MNAITQLKNFHCERKLEGAVIAFITNQMMTKEAEEKLHRIFEAFDSNKDGALTDDELREGFKEFMGEQLLGECDLEEIMKRIDFNQDGMIQYSEFIMAASNMKNMMTEINLKYAFDLFDLD